VEAKLPLKIRLASANTIEPGTIRLSVLHKSWKNFRFLVCAAGARLLHTPKIGFLQNIRDLLVIQTKKGE
jgi:hypothetical protein